VSLKITQEVKYSKAQQTHKVNVMMIRNKQYKTNNTRQYNNQSKTY